MSTKQPPADTNTIKDPANWASGGDPMTGAQASYLKTLSDEAHEPAPDETLSKSDASIRINELKEELQLQPPTDKRRKAG